MGDPPAPPRVLHCSGYGVRICPSHRSQDVGAAAGTARSRPAGEGGSDPPRVPGCPSVSKGLGPAGSVFLVLTVCSQNSPKISRGRRDPEGWRVPLRDTGPVEKRVFSLYEGSTMYK